MSWNDYELNRRSLEMKSTAALFADRMRKGDLDGIKEMADAMKRTAEMALEHLEELKRERS